MDCTVILFQSFTYRHVLTPADSSLAYSSTDEFNYRSIRSPGRSSSGTFFHKYLCSTMHSFAWAMSQLRYDGTPLVGASSFVSMFVQHSSFSLEYYWYSVCGYQDFAGDVLISAGSQPLISNYFTIEPLCAKRSYLCPKYLFYLSEPAFRLISSSEEGFPNFWIRMLTYLRIKLTLFASVQNGLEMQF